MLGYVKIDKGELKVREYEVYTGYYCGVCKSIGKRYGQLPRMALSYDAAFLAVLLASLEDMPDSPVQEHCIGHRIKKKTIIRGRAVDYAGDVMLILAWYKLLDDAEDEGRLYAKATMLVLKGIYKKLRSKYSALCRDIEAHLRELSTLEKEKCDSLDVVAEAFAKIMEVIFAEGIKELYRGNAAADKNNGSTDAIPQNKAVSGSDTGNSAADSCRRGDGKAGSDAGLANAGRSTKIDGAAEITLCPEENLARIGYHMGKWIYLIDAVDDIEENIESGAYNPLLYRFNYDAAAETPEEFRRRIEDDLRFNLFHYLAVVSNYADSLDIKKNQGIIENVIYFGLNRKTEEIINRTEPEKRI